MLSTFKMWRLNSKPFKIKFYMYQQNQSCTDNRSAGLLSLAPTSFLPSENKSNLNYIPVKLPSLPPLLTSSIIWRRYLWTEDMPFRNAVRPYWETSFTEAKKFSSKRSRCKKTIKTLSVSYNLTSSNCFIYLERIFIAPDKNTPMLAIAAENYIVSRTHFCPSFHA